jgi:hypothetical protein
MMTSEKRTIYITGRGGDANKGLGGYLKSFSAPEIGFLARYRCSLEPA